MAIKLAASDPRTIYLTQSAAKSSAGLQIAEWEQTMNALHAKEMPTDNYGFDRYCDFHLGHAHVAGTLDPIITKLKSYDGKYRFFVPPNGELAILSRASSRCPSPLPCKYHHCRSRRDGALPVHRGAGRAVRAVHGHGQRGARARERNVLRLLLGALRCCGRVEFRV